VVVGMMNPLGSVITRRQRILDKCKFIFRLPFEVGCADSGLSESTGKVTIGIAREAPLADTNLNKLLNGLTRAVAEPAGYPLFARKGVDGLFPGTAAGKAAAEAAVAEGFLFCDPHTERAHLTEAGRSFVKASADPRVILEDFLRVMEKRQAELAEIQSTLQGLRESTQAMRLLLQECLSPSGGQQTMACDEVVRQIEVWRATNPSGDLPLPRLYRSLPEPRPSIGVFHDMLRQLQGLGRIALHPWTGPRYEIPEPAFALLAGHDIAYYANLV
jgi:hypothetical protein